MKLFLKILTSLILTTSSLVILYFVFIPIPDFDIVKEIKLKESIKLFDRSGEVVLFDLSKNEQRVYEDLNNISPHFLNAVISIEDQNFYNHNGIHFSSIFRSFIKNIKTLSFSQGGSTISQQLVKNSLLQSHKKITRKIREAILAIKIERSLSKNNILELYVNLISYGHTVYGVGEAATYFYGKDAADLTIAESAYLASLIKAPSFFSPFGKNRELLEVRKNIVLQNMLDLNYINRSQYIKAKNEFVYFQGLKDGQIKAPHFVFFVKDELEKRFGVDLSNIAEKNIVTTLDWDTQVEVEKLVRKWEEHITTRSLAKNIGVVVQKVDTGEILAMVGSFDYFDTVNEGNVNATISLKQPGSSFKPFVYAEAFENGFDTETQIFDAKTQFTEECEQDDFETHDECYSVVNYDGEFLGPVTLRDALAQSRNIPAVKLLHLVGLNNVINLSKDLGIKTIDKSNNYGLSLALGTGGVRLLDVVNAYSTFPRVGVYKDFSFLKETSSLYKSKKSIPVLSKNTSSKINSILSDTQARYPIIRSQYVNVPGFETALKTGTAGTSTLAKDLWTIGYTNDVVVGIWAGNNDETSLSGLGGILIGLWGDIINFTGKKYGKTAVFEKHTTEEFIYNLKDQGQHRSILHFINKKDKQYKNWEYGVRNWFEEGGEVLKVEDNSENTPKEGFNLIFNSKDLYFGKDVYVYVDGGDKITNYEFYVNSKFISVTSLPFIRIKSENLNIGENTISVVANGSSVYTKESVIVIKNNQAEF